MPEEMSRIGDTMPKLFTLQSLRLYFKIYQYQENKSTHTLHFLALNSNSDHYVVHYMCSWGISALLRFCHRSLKIGPLYSFINETTTVFVIITKRAKISSLNFLCVSIMRLWQHLYRYIFMTSFMTSPGHKVGQILKCIYLHQCLN